ncbi:MAG: hypothetical protein KAI79_11890 [Bacteroidales bacterium]|nr:hypothetical protein [Bacteroidales bacterium]
MKIAFYKAFQERATKVDVAIALASFGNYSHVELIFSNGESFSVSGRDGGARFKEISYNPEVWDIKEIDITDYNESRIREEANLLVGTEYDYIGALSSVFPFCLQRYNDKLFCSETVVNLINKYYGYKNLKDGCKYSPSKLFKCINK